MSGRRISRRSVLALAACTALGAVGCGRAEEYTGPELILRYAENQPEDYPTTQAALAFADLVAQRTEGRVKVVVYSGGGLGAEQSVIEQMQYGGIDFARVSLSQLAEQLGEAYFLVSYDNTSAPNVGSITTEVYDGGTAYVTLTGTTTYQAKKVWADDDSSRLPGVPRVRWRVVSSVSQVGSTGSRARSASTWSRMLSRLSPPW